MSHVLSPKAKRFYLPQCRHVRLGGVDCHRPTEESAQSASMAYVVDPDASVDQNEAVRVRLE
jgi:hypothetical protein